MKTLNTNDAANLARKLMDHFGLQDWKFAFDRAKLRAGLCSYRNKTISLSYFFVLNNDPRTLTPLDLTLPAMTPGQELNALLWQTIDRVRVSLQGNDPQTILDNVRSLLR